MTIGEKIRALRKKRGLTQGRLAQMMDVHVLTVSDWEKNRYEPKFDKVERLAEILGVDTAELWSEPAESRYTSFDNVQSTKPTDSGAQSEVDQVVRDILASVLDRHARGADAGSVLMIARAMSGHPAERQREIAAALCTLITDSEDVTEEE